MVIPSPVQVNADTTNSCKHWFCCFGCKCCSGKVQTQDSPQSMSLTTTHTVSPTEDKTTEVYHTYHRRQHMSLLTPTTLPPSSPLVRSPEFDPIAGISTPVKR